MADQRMSTRQARWAVGDWILVVAPHGAILLSPEAPGTLDEDLWEQIHTDGVSLASVLDTLVMGAGGRLARIPDFGLVILGRDRVHLALRGGVVAEVDGARIDAEGVVTWYECRVASAESLALYAPGAADSASARLHPVRDAVLPASAVHLSVGPAAAESALPSASADSAAFAGSAEEPVLTVVEEDAEAAAAAAAMAAMVAAAAQIEEAARQAEEAEDAARAEDAEEAEDAAQAEDAEEAEEAARVARAIAQAEALAQAEDAEALAQARAAEALAAVAAAERGEAAEPAEPEGPVGGSATSAESADDVAGGPSAHSAASAVDAAPPASAPSAPSADAVAPAGPAGPPAPVVSPVSASSVPSADDDVFSVPSASPVSAASADEPAPAAALLGPSPRHAAPPAEPEEEPAPSAASAAFADDDPTPVSGIIVPTDIPSPVEDSASTPQIIVDVEHPLDEPPSSTGTGDDDPDEAPAGGSTGDEPQLVDADRVPRAGDHDGWTVAELPAELVNELGQTLTGSEPGSDRPVIDAPKKSPTAPRTALSAICPEGHANPTNYVKCRECGRALAQPARVIICPPLGRVRTSTGEVVELDRPVLVGRAPAPSEVRGPGDSAPAVLTVPSPEQLVSRNHLLIELDEWSVLARNLSESNGTLLLREGEPARKIPSSEPVLLRAGDILDLGDGQSLVMEDLP